MKKAAILVVDDEPLACFTIAEMVEAAGYRAVQANSAQTALELMETNEFDALITDIVMPEMDGNALISAIRVKANSLPIIAVSGSGRTSSYDYVKVAEQVGASKVLHKPFLLEELENTLAELLS